jgi:glyoxylase-like metal-dependent hydrolase (beta-lactamase superfamily II)
MKIQHFHDPRTGSFTYVVSDDASKTAVVIDAVMDYEPKSGRVFFESAETVARYIDENGFSVPFVLDTHTHADHLTAMPFFRVRYGAKSVIGSGVTTVQATFKQFFDLDPAMPTDGSQFDILLDDHATLDAGPFEIEAIPTGGHTPASLSYRIRDAVFVGDSLFQPDSGTARCDFPGASAAELYDSIQRLFALPDETRVFTLHDYQPGGRELAFESTIGAQRRGNIHVHDGISREEFIALRSKLEVGKEVPTLLFPSVQVNIRAGNLPEPEQNGVSYLKIPLNALGTETS